MISLRELPPGQAQNGDELRGHVDLSQGTNWAEDPARSERSVDLALQAATFYSCAGDALALFDARGVIEVTGFPSRLADPRLQAQRDKAT